MNYKWKLFWHQILVMTFENRMRAVLTALGIFSGLFVFSAGNLFLNSYYESCMSELEDMPDTSIFTAYYGENESEASKELLFASDDIPLVEKVSYNETCVQYTEKNEKMVYVGARVHAISKASNVLINYTGNYGVNPVIAELTQGRFITSREISDNEQVCMLDEYGANLLFGDENPIGQKVLFHYYSDGEEIEFEPVSYTVVGILKNQYYSEKQSNDYLDQLMDEEKNEVYASINIYCPYDAMDYLPELIIDKYFYVWNSNEENMCNVKEDVQNSCTLLQSEGINVIDVMDKEKRIQQMETELKPLRVAFTGVTLILLMIAGICSMSILFFSMKERREEIGMKKAFGAKSIHLLLQFLMENVFLAIIAASVAVAASIILGFMLQGFFAENILKDFRLYIHASTILQPLVVGILFGAVFSVVPCTFYSSKNVTELLREKD